MTLYMGFCFKFAAYVKKPLRKDDRPGAPCRALVKNFAEERGLDWSSSLFR